MDLLVEQSGTVVTGDTVGRAGGKDTEELDDRVTACPGEEMHLAFCV